MKYTYDKFLKLSEYYIDKVEENYHYHEIDMPFKPYKKDDLIFSTYIITGGTSN